MFMRQHVNGNESSVRFVVNVMSGAPDQPACPRAKHMLGRGPNS